MKTELTVTTDEPTPGERRAELLGDETIAFLRELAANAPPLTEEQRDVIRAAFRSEGNS
jgi:hypothetical protein